VLENDEIVEAQFIDVGDRLKISYAPVDVHDQIAADAAFNRVVKIEQDGIDEEVYCCTIASTHQVGLSMKILTSQCGEQPLLPFESCNLASINLTKFVMDNGKINFGHLQSTVETAVDFLDSVIDVNVFPTRSIKDATNRTRKIGLGIMGWADTLVKMGIPYDSQEAIKLACTVMETIKTRAIIRSEELANQYGAFELYDIDKLPMIGKRRNATLTTIAPTGTISMIAGCSSGIEPLFALAYKKMNVLDGTDFEYFNQQLLEQLELIGQEKTDWIKQQVIETGSLPPLAGHDASKLTNIFKTSHQISPRAHIDMQAAFQAYTCNSVSKTINMSHDSTIDDIMAAYRTAFNEGCKGITIYRDKSREEQVLEKGIEIREPEIKDTHEPRGRPQALSGLTQKVETSCGTMYVTINWNGDGKPFEVFTRVGKAGGCASSQSEAMGRMVSLALRSGVHPSHIVKQLRGISCHLPRGMGNNKVLSCADGVAQVLESVFMKEHPVHQVLIRGACPECQGPIEQQSGCSVCRNCGYSDCS
jgi:ribonucleoside-diphosphate reductase alpha chain